jgi:hypothetical protein
MLSLVDNNPNILAIWGDGIGITNPSIYLKGLSYTSEKFQKQRAIDDAILECTATGKNAIMDPGLI